MSVVANVAINIDAKNAASVLNEIKKKVEEMNGAFDKLPNAGEKTKGLASELIGLGAKFVSAAAAAEVLRKSISASFERSQAETRLKALTSAYGETAEATKMAAAASDKFGLTQTDATKAIADVYGRLRPLGFSLKEISGVYDGFNVLTKQAGISSAEASSVFTQLSQALGSGTLRGDEFNRMAESMPAILGIVAKELNVNQGALRGMAEKGQITGDVVVRALQKVAGSAKDLDKFLDPSAKAMNELAKQSEEAQVQLGNLLKPAAIAVLQGLAKALEFTVKYMKQIAQTAVFFATFAGTLKLIALGTQAWATASKALAAGQKAAGVAAAFLQGVINPASLATTALALGVATAASYALGKAMDGAATDAKEIDPAAQKAAKAATVAAEASRKLKEELEKAKAKALELAIEMQGKVVAAAKAASAAIEQQISTKEQIGGIVGAQIDGEIKLNELYKIGLERQYKMAATAAQRRDIAIKIANQEIRAAQLVYQQTLANLRIENEKLKLQEQAAVSKGYEILAEGKLQILKAKTKEEAAEKTRQLNEALVAQNSVIQATAAESAAQTVLNGIIAQTAGTQYQIAAATATAGLEQKLLGEDIGMSAKQAKNLADRMLYGATNTDKMNNLSQELSGRMDTAAAALNAGTQAAVGNAQVFTAVARDGIESQDQWRERVLAGVGAQQQVAVATEETTGKVVAANNIRAMSANQTNKEIADSAGFSEKRVEAAWALLGTWWQTNIIQPVGNAWKQLTEFLPKAANVMSTTIKNTFSQMGNAIKNTLNAVLRGVFGAVNGAIDNINRLIRAANAISAKVKGPQFAQLGKLSVPQFAEGGVVTKPTLAMVGEGGEPEYIIPASKMADASANFLNGSRGDSVISTQGGGGSAPTINITTGPVVEFNNQQYVTMQDFQSGMRQVADGIYQGLRKPSVRAALRMS